MNQFAGMPLIYRNTVSSARVVALTASCAAARFCGTKLAMAQRWVFAGLALMLCALLWTIAAWPVSREAEREAPTRETISLEAAPVATGRAEPDDAPRQPAAAPPTDDPAVQTGPAEPEVAQPGAAPEPALDPEAEADLIFTRENGPLAEYKAQFEREPRDSAAHSVEQHLRDAFQHGDGPQPVFRAVLCRESICKLEVRISSQNLGAYVAAMGRIVHQSFDPKLATERTSLAQAGEVSVTVYAKRLPAPAQ